MLHCVMMGSNAQSQSGLLSVTGNNAFNIKVHTLLKLDLSTCKLSALDTVQQAAGIPIP